MIVSCELDYEGFMIPTKHGIYAAASIYPELHSVVFLAEYKGALFQPYGESSPSAFFDNCVVTISNGNVDHGTKHVAIIVDFSSGGITSII
jgi:hypothetical protein